MLLVLILVLNAFVIFFTCFFSLRFCMLFYINKFSFLFCFWFWFWYYWNAFVIFFTCSFFHSDFACYFTSINFLFCFTLFSILKFSLFDYVEIKIIKNYKRALIIFHLYFILFYFLGLLLTSASISWCFVIFRVIFLWE